MPSERNLALTHERLKELLHYDPETGVFTHLTSGRGRGRKAGARAGCFGGYTRVGVCGRVYRAHRLAWFYVYGVWPREQLDHINLDISDNRLANLREATVAQNGANCQARRRNKCGKKGVSKLKGKWRAQIFKNKRQVHLGLFATAEEAHSAYIAAARDHYGEFARAE